MQKKLLCPFNKILIIAIGMLATHNATAINYQTNPNECDYFEKLYTEATNRGCDTLKKDYVHEWVAAACIQSADNTDCLRWYDEYGGVSGGMFEYSIDDFVCWGDNTSSLTDAANTFGLYYCSYDIGDVCDDLSNCPNFEGWQSTGTPGYEEYRISSNDSCWCMENYVMEYRCAEGYVGNTTDGQTGCVEFSCPTNACCGIAGQMYNGDLQPLAGINVFLQTSDTMPNPAAGGHLYGETTTDSNGVFQIDDCTSIINSYGTDGRMYLRAAAVGNVPHEEWINSSNMSNISAILYEDLATDDNITCTDTQYREYDKTTKVSVCKACPSINGIQGTNTTNSSGHFWYRIYDCHIPTTQSFTDSTGTWNFNSACYYTE